MDSPELDTWTFKGLEDSGQLVMISSPLLHFTSFQSKHKDTLNKTQVGNPSNTQSGAPNDAPTPVFNTGIRSSNYYAHKLTLTPLIMKIAYKTKALPLDRSAQKLSALENCSGGREKRTPFPGLEMTLGKEVNPVNFQFSQQ